MKSKREALEGSAVRPRPLLAFCVILLVVGVSASGQTVPSAKCQLKDYQRSPGKFVQVVVLRDPAGQQEAEFDLTHGGSLVSLRYDGRELVFRHGGGSDLEMYRVRNGRERALKGLSPYWSSFDPDQAGSSMGGPATVAGVACQGTRAMKAFAMMIDAGIDSSFRPHPLIAVWKGRVSPHYPPGYSTPFSLETDASWVVNPRGTPKYYLKIQQRVVNIRPQSFGTMQWFVKSAVPWRFEYQTGYPDHCSEKEPCKSETTPVIAAGRYESMAHRGGLAVVVPTTDWKTKRLYLGKRVNAYGGAPVVPRRTVGVVLSRPLSGTEAFQFSWYLCAGSWAQARAFAEALRH